MNPIPFAVSTLWGLLTAFGLWLLTIPLSFGEIGGPINWAVAYLIVSGLTLAIATFTARAKGRLSGVACGILFSAPIVGACHLVSHRDASVLREHGGQLKFTAIAVVVLSLLVMSGVAQLRNTPRLNEGATDKNF